MNTHNIKIDNNLCIGCGLCADVCAEHNLEIRNKKASIVSKSCMLCGQCSAVCPQRAISVTGYKDQQIERTMETRLNPEEVLNVIRFRRSIRSFQNKELPHEVMAQILEAGRLTHTEKNMQDVSFVVLEKEKDWIERMAVDVFRKIKPFANLISPLARRNRITEHFFFFEAPAVIVIIAKEKTNGLLAAQNMEFVAEANGLGVLFSGFFTMAANASFKIKKALQIPKGKKVVATLVLGYPKIKFRRGVHRKELDVRYM